MTENYQLQNLYSPPPYSLDRKLTNDEINALPVAQYDGPIHLIDTEVEMKKAVEVLAEEPVLGFDTETRPSFRKGESYPASLLQLGGESSVYIFRLAPLGLTDELCELLSNEKIIKAGVAIARDVKELVELNSFIPRSFVDLGDAARHASIQHHGLRGLGALLFGKRITKQARLTNWAKPNLDKRAINYAATDAWMGLSIYKRMKSHHVICNSFDFEEAERRRKMKALRHSDNF